MEATIIPALKTNSNLDDRFTFENFIKSTPNQEAKDMALFFANFNDGRSYSFYIYGKSGTGKTHLVHAIGNSLQEKFRVLYMTAEDFFDKYIFDKTNGYMPYFFSFFDDIDALIIDDLEDIIYKEGAMNIIVRIFDKFHVPEKRLVVTSTHSSNELFKMNIHIDQRIHSRFKSGFEVQLEPANYELKKNIIFKKLFDLQYKLPELLIEYLAIHSGYNLRELEGIINVLFFKKLSTIEELEKELKKNDKEITIDKIIDIVCKYFNLPKELMCINTRKREVVQLRQVAMYFSKNLTKSSLATIGSQIGDKDHATVIHACKQINNLYETDKRFRNNINEIETLLKK